MLIWIRSYFFACYSNYYFRIYIQYWLSHHNFLVYNLVYGLIIDKIIINRDFFQFLIYKLEYNLFEFIIWYIDKY